VDAERAGADGGATWAAIEREEQRRGVRVGRAAVSLLEPVVDRARGRPRRPQSRTRRTCRTPRRWAGPAAQRSCPQDAAAHGPVAGRGGGVAMESSC
jgi:hypothetical protein